MTAFVAAAQQEHYSFAMPGAVHAVFGTDMHAQFDHAFTDRLTITKVARLHLTQANANACLSYFVADGIKPFGKGSWPLSRW